MNSSIFVFSFIVVVNLSLSGAQIRKSRHSNSAPLYDRQDEVINIGNGENRRNVVVIDQDQNTGNQANNRGSPPYGLNNRFGGSELNTNTLNSNYPNQAQPRQGPTRFNVGNGVQNYNDISLNDNGRTQPVQSTGHLYNGGKNFAKPSGNGYGTNNHNNINGRIPPTPAVNTRSRAPIPQNNFDHDTSNEGMSFVSPSGNERFNIGFGPDNYNKVLINGVQLPSATPEYHTADTSDNINQVFVNGRVKQPDYTSASGFSTYSTGGGTIHVLNNSEIPRNPPEFGNMEKLRDLSAQLQKIQNELHQEAARMNIKLEK